MISVTPFPKLMVLFRHATVIGNSGRHLETVEQFDPVLEFYIIVLEVFLVQVLEIEGGVFQLFVDFVHDPG